MIDELTEDEDTVREDGEIKVKNIESVKLQNCFNAFLKDKTSEKEESGVIVNFGFLLRDCRA